MTCYSPFRKGSQWHHGTRRTHPLCTLLWLIPVYASLWWTTNAAGHVTGMRRDCHRVATCDGAGDGASTRATCAASSISPCRWRNIWSRRSSACVEEETDCRPYRRVDWTFCSHRHRSWQKTCVRQRRCIYGTAQAFGVTEVKKYHRSEDFSKDFFVYLQRSLSAYRSHSEESDVHGFFLTAVLDPKDPCFLSKEMTGTIHAEVKGLLQRGTLNFIKDIPPDGNVMPGKFVLAIKST